MFIEQHTEQAHTDENPLVSEPAATVILTKVVAERFEEGIILGAVEEEKLIEADCGELFGAVRLADHKVRMQSLAHRARLENQKNVMTSGLLR